MLTISGEVFNWSMMDNGRKFASTVMTYSQLVKYVVPKVFNALNGQGEQRELSSSHVRKLKKEMISGRYVPTSISASLRKSHQKSLKIEGNQYELSISEKDPLARTDGNHRVSVIESIEVDIHEKLQKDSLSGEHEWLRQQLEIIQNLPFVVLIYFDGDPREDFIRLQASKTVDKTHLMSLGVRTNSEQSPNLRESFEIATLLHKDPESPLHNQIRFDSRGSGIPFATIAPKGSSDLIGSLVGLSRVGTNFGIEESSTLASFVATAHQAILKKTPDLLGYGDRGKVLTTPANGGAKGAASMLIGLGTILAYRCLASGRNKPNKNDLALLVESAGLHLDEAAFGNLSGPSKRVLLREFAIDMLGGLEEPYHERVPVGLLNILSPSSFVVSPPPKNKPELPDPENVVDTSESTKQTLVAKKRRSKKTENQA